MGQSSGCTLRPCTNMISIDREDDDYQAISSKPSNKRIAYVSDVEGHWQYFCSFVEAAEGIYFKQPVDHREDTKFDESELDLLPGWQFVFGGDCCDKGPGTLRFLHAIIELKKKYPSRVHFILGNRDINKMRWSSELAQSELERIEKVPVSFWQPSKIKTHAEFIREIEAAEKGSEVAQTIQLSSSEHNTKANKLRYLMDCDMGSAGEFEFRRQELKHMGSPHGDEDVVRSYESSILNPDGLMRQYLEHAKLGVLIGCTLFVHGQIIGNGFNPDVCDGVDSDGTACCIGVVPGESNKQTSRNFSFEQLPAIATWLEELNGWAYSQVNQWKASPLWSRPPTEATYEAWSGRGGSDLIAYGTPGSPVPTVVYCRYLTKDSMPLHYPKPLVQYLERNRVHFVVVGHTPHGNAPTVIQHGGVSVIMGDSSFSDMKANKFFQGDNRGTAACAITFDILNGTSRVRGTTPHGQQIEYEIGITELDHYYLGQELHNQLVDKKYFVKARVLPSDWPNANAQFLISHIKGFSYEYQLLDSKELVDAMQTGSWNGIVATTSHVPEVHLTREQRITKIFDLLSPDLENRVETFQMLDMCTDPICKAELTELFPRADLLRGFTGAFQLMKSVDRASITTSDFRQACESSKATAIKGIYFPILLEGGLTSGDFPDALRPFKATPTVVVNAMHLRIEMRQAPLSQWSAHSREIELDSRRVFQENLFSNVLGNKLPADAISIRSFVSCTRVVNVATAERKHLNIPGRAVYFAWCYPFLKPFGWAREIAGNESLKENPDAQFLMNGGYIYMDKQFKPIHINAVVPNSDGPLRFGKPKPLDPKWLLSQLHRRKFQPVTLPYLLEKGAREFCWLEPEVEIEERIGESPHCEFGGFAYVVR